MPLTVVSTPPLPQLVPNGQKWSGSVSSSTPVGGDITAVVFVFAEVGKQRVNNGALENRIYSLSETTPFISLKGEVKVTPLPPIEPLRLEPGDKISVAKLGIDQPLTLYSVSRDGVMPNPGQTEIGIYDFAAFGLSVAGSPKSGNTVLSAFYSNRQGAGPFRRILNLVAGDAIDLVYQGKAYHYTVVWKCTIPTSDFDEVVRKQDVDTLTLLPGVGGPTQYIIRAELNPGSISKDCPVNTTPFPGTEMPGP